MNKSELMDAYYRMKLARRFETRVAGRCKPQIAEKAPDEDPGGLSAKRQNSNGIFKAAWRRC